MREVSLAEMLDARDRRAQAQRQLLEAYGLPLLSFTMNIPGPVKDSPLIRRGFAEGLRRLDGALSAAGIETRSRHVVHAVTGSESLCAVQAEAPTLKAICTGIEDASPMGRLFDMDVIGPEGQKLARGEERRCLVCGAAGRGCASRRLHSLEELSAAVTGLLREGLLAADGERIDALATRALLDEVETSPKPGLVDRNNSGSHRDMTPATFARSAAALQDFWQSCFLTGVKTAGLPAEEVFSRLRELGLEAEDRMFSATGGVNTHKGAIFTLGTVCAAIGRLWQPEAPCRDPRRIAETCAELSRAAVSADFAALDRGGTPKTAGERLYLSRGLRGIRGELAAGLPAVMQTGLPHLESGLAHGLSRNDAGVLALLHLIARGEDSNMLKRGGPALAAQAVSRVRDLLTETPFPSEEAVRELDAAFIRQDLSPGGCADLLAVSYFLHAWQQDGEEVPGC